MSRTNEHGRGNGQRPLRGFIVDSAYATIGLGGATVGVVRSIDQGDAGRGSRITTAVGDDRFAA